MDSVTIKEKHSAEATARSRSDANWQAVEREYRAGQLSVREIGRLHGVSHTAIAKRAWKEGWTRDLAAKVRTEVVSRLVSSEVASGNADQAVDDAASRAVALVREHRQDVRAARRLVTSLVVELQDASDNIDDIEVAIEAESDSNRRRAMMKAVSLPTRASVITNLTAALKNVVTLERGVFGLDSDTPIVQTTLNLPMEEFEEIARRLIESV